MQLSGEIPWEVYLADPTKGGNGKPAQEIAFDLIKSAHFRVIHVDGAVGGPTPQGLMHIAFYAERSPIPRRIVQGINPDGTLSMPIQEKTVIRDALIRELEVDAIMSLPVAEQLHKWLGDRIDELKKLTSGIKQ